jgi:hypothetical protein
MLKEKPNIMKHIAFIFFSLLLHLTSFADSNRVAPGTNWTHSWTEGEDASSSFYYFIEDRGQVKRMRIMWNGGNQKKPTVTDYIFELGAIRIVEQEGTRENIPDLILGQDTGLKTLSDSKILRHHTGMMLVPEPPRKTLSDSERIQLNNMIDLLLQDRTLYKLKEAKK